MPREKKALSDFGEAVEANNAAQNMTGAQRVNSVDEMENKMEAEFAAEAVPTVDAMGNPVSTPAADTEFAAEPVPIEAQPNAADTEFGSEVPAGEIHVDAQRLRDAYKTNPENPENKPKE